MVSGNDWRRSADHDRRIRSMVPDIGGNHCRGAVRIQIKKEPTKCRLKAEVFRKWIVLSL